MTKTKIHFMRHGEVHNPEKVLYGRMPGFPLSNNGKKSVNEAGKLFRKRNISAIYTSPMLRAQETAGIISEYIGKKPKISPLLTEVKLIFEGMPTSEYKKKYQPYIFSDKYVKQGNESVSEIKDRIMKFMDKTVKNHKNENIIIVSHGDPIVVFLAYVIKSDFTWEFKRDNYLKTATWMSFIYDHEKNKWVYESKLNL